eukprot:COSAG01_NODE_777_length_13689_cov_18.035467_4_plen_101_part_00
MMSYLLSVPPSTAARAVEDFCELATGAKGLGNVRCASCSQGCSAAAAASGHRHRNPPPHWWSHSYVWVCLGGGGQTLLAADNARSCVLSCAATVPRSSWG